MRYLMFPGLVLMLFAWLSSAQSGQQSNQPEPLALLASAKFVYIEPYGKLSEAAQTQSAIPVSRRKTGKR